MLHFFTFSIFEVYSGLRVDGTDVLQLGVPLKPPLGILQSTLKPLQSPSGVEDLLSSSRSDVVHGFAIATGL